MSNEVSTDMGNGKGLVEGICVSRLEPAVDAVVGHFKKFSEVGASAVVVKESETTVGLSSGRPSEESRMPW